MKYKSVLSDVSLDGNKNNVLSSFICRNHKLLIKAVIYKIPQDLKEYEYEYTQQEIEDEFHYIFDSTFFANQRHTYLPKYCQKHPPAPEFGRIMNDTTTIL